MRTLPLQTPIKRGTEGNAIMCGINFARKESGRAEERAVTPPARPGADPVAAERLLRELRYYEALLKEGYLAAAHGTCSLQCLRTERVALNIDYPEFDAVSMWARKGENGTVSIPFVEFITRRLHDGLHRLQELVAVPEKAFAEPCNALTRLERQAVPDGTQPLSVPRLKEVPVDTDAVAALIDGEEALLGRTLAVCERALSSVR